jgi:hypothetical protein
VETGFSPQNPADPRLRSAKHRNPARNRVESPTQSPSATLSRNGYRRDLPNPQTRRLLKKQTPMPVAFTLQNHSALRPIGLFSAFISLRTLSCNMWAKTGYDKDIILLKRLSWGQFRGLRSFFRGAIRDIWCFCRKFSGFRSLCCFSRYDGPCGNAGGGFAVLCRDILAILRRII